MFNSEPIIILKRPEPDVTVEIVRSFSYKLNVGNYESRDFFCSQKSQCKLEDAERISDALYQFCKAQVMKAVQEWYAQSRAQKEGKQDANSRTQ